MDKTLIFIQKAKKIHGDKYDYCETIYDNSKKKVVITCRKHGNFNVTPNNHLKGSGCPNCRPNKKLTREEFIQRAKEVHGDKYDYSLVEYKNRRTKIKIICKEHGEFEQTASDHLQGCGCKICGKKISINKRNIGTSKFIDKAIKIHGDKYDYSKVKYENTFKKIKIICKEHGEFEQTPHNHLKGFGCVKCKYEKLSRQKTCSEEEFIQKAKEVHGDKYDYINIGYTKVMENIDITCKKHGKFTQKANNHLNGSGCPKCSNSMISKAEKELYKFLSKYASCEQNNRTILNKKEIDIYIPSKKIAIEFDGLYWHSDNFLENNYHLNKTIECQEQEVRLIHIFEDEWVYKQEIVKSRLKNILGITQNRIFARKCEVRLVSVKDKSKFLDQNHIQGKVGSKVNVGLYFENELISLMTFGMLRKNLGSSDKEGHWELLRFCNKLNYNVVGGASRLLNYFKKNYNWQEIISYADLRWSDGNLYEVLGFEEIHRTKPNYFYVKSMKREDRFKYRKSELLKWSWGTEDQTEKEIMFNKRYHRIYDCGNIKFKLSDNEINNKKI